MNLRQAIEMTESLNEDTELGISTLGNNGDEIAILLLGEINRLNEILEHNIDNEE